MTKIDAATAKIARSNWLEIQTKPWKFWVLVYLMEVKNWHQEKFVRSIHTNRKRWQQEGHPDQIELICTPKRTLLRQLARLRITGLLVWQVNTVSIRGNRPYFWESIFSLKKSKRPVTHQLQAQVVQITRRCAVTVLLINSSKGSQW